MKKNIIVSFLFLFTYFTITSCKKKDLCASNQIELSGNCVDKADINYYGNLNFNCINSDVILVLNKSDSTINISYISNLKFKFITTSSQKYTSQNETVLQSLNCGTIQVLCPISEIIAKPNVITLKVYLEEMIGGLPTYTDSTSLVLTKR